MTAPLELYLTALDGISAVVDAVPADRWNAATPCSDWSARQLLGHLIDGQHQVVAMATGEGPRPPVTEPQALALLTGSDPGAAWRRTREVTDGRLRGIPAGATVATRLGDRNVEQLLAIALVEPVVHGWDLATATGQPSLLDPAAVAALLPGVLALGDQLHASGMYRPSIDVPDGALPHERLLAALGRTPTARAT